MKVSNGHSCAISLDLKVYCWTHFKCQDDKRKEIYTNQNNKDKDKDKNKADCDTTDQVNELNNQDNQCNINNVVNSENN